MRGWVHPTVCLSFSQWSLFLFYFYFSRTPIRNNLNCWQSVCGYGFLSVSERFLWFRTQWESSYKFSINSLFVLKDSVIVWKNFLILSPNRKSPKVLTVCPYLKILINVWRNFLVLDPKRKSPLNSVLKIFWC